MLQSRLCQWQATKTLPLEGPKTRNYSFSEAQKAVRISRRPRVILSSASLPSNKNAVARRRESLLEPTGLRKAKAVRAAPSNNLILALEYLGHSDIVSPAAPGKKDLSYARPWQTSTPASAKDKRAVGRLMTPESIAQTRLTSLSLPEILVRYLLYIHPYTGLHGDATPPPDWGSKVLGMFDDRTVEYLRCRSYDVKDVMTWAWIVAASDAKVATLRLFLAANQSGSGMGLGAKVPSFVFLFLLRREHIDARSLKLLLVHAWRMLGGLPTHDAEDTLRILSDQVPASQYLPLTSEMQASDISTHVTDESTVMILVVRLLRHARRVWPQSLVAIAVLITSHIGRRVALSSLGGISRLDARTSTRLTRLYNSALSLLSIPSTIGPFRSVPYHQRAQFRLIRRMTEFDPPLSITRKGFQAVTRVQLAHRKTVAEGAWAEKKAKSWPPWKVDRLGIDMGVGPADGKTRAMEAMDRMEEAGYSASSFERVANIFAGWDTDGSPTIQTRSIVRRVAGQARQQTDRAATAGVVEGIVSESRDVWAARIRATRNVSEAWACVLSLEDQKARPSSDVYFAMLEKLVFERRRMSKLANTTSSSEGEDALQTVPSDRTVSGDGKEVSQAALSPNDAIYLRVPLPSVMDLINQMTRDAIRLSISHLSFLVHHAESARQAFRILEGFGHGEDARVLNADYTNLDADDSPRMLHLCRVPEKLFSAFIHLLCRMPRSALDSAVAAMDGDMESDAARERPRAGFPRRDCLQQACDLMRLRKPKYRPPWNSLLSALRSAGSVRIDKSSSAEGRLPPQLRSWKILREVVHQMRCLNLELDGQGFYFLCRGLEDAVTTSLETLADERPSSLDRSAALSSMSRATPTECAEIERACKAVLQHGASYVMAAFDRLTGTQGAGSLLREHSAQHAHEQMSRHGSIPSSLMIPSLLAIPEPVVLHALARVLGLLGNEDGMLELLRWMAAFASDLDVVIHEQSNGKRMLRRTLAAIRLFLERGPDGAGSSDATSRATVLQARRIVDGVEGWGGWPGDEELEAYSRGGKVKITSVF
ncbi:MAG: hypothetical protein M1825_005289 [Sarcosagium campestre]|nr:MAG: hypothetical protein M1825_005289 [Sarcosagium campestre]